MKVVDLRQKSQDDLNSLLLTLLRESFNFRMQKGTGQLSKPDQVKKVRRDIARVQTLLNELQV